MRFIAFHLLQAPDWLADAEVYRREIELMVLAEDLGFDAVWIAEHHFHHYGIDPDPLLLATHVAAHTKRIRVGTAANVMTLMHPLRVAEQAAMLDILSGGRVDVGFAKGYGPREFAAYGIDQRQADERFREALEIVVTAWTQPRFTYQGKHFQVPPTTLRPRPVSKPHPPAYVATTGTQPTMELAARLGLPFYVAYRGREHFHRMKDTYAALARKAGRTEEQVQAALARVAVMQTAYVAPTIAESKDDARPGVEWMSASVDSVNVPEDLDRWPLQLQELIRKNYDRPDRPERGYRDFENYWRGYVYGDPERAAERVGHLHEAGVENLVLGFSFGGLPYEKVRRSMELFAKYVMARYR